MRLTVGDIAVVAAETSPNWVEDGMRQLKNMRIGLTVSDLHEGSSVEPSTSESQEIAARIAKKHMDRVEMREGISELRSVA